MNEAIDRGTTDTPLLEDTIGANLEATVARHGDCEAFVVPHQGIRQTWREFNASVDEVAKGLLAAGIEAGDRVGMWSPNYAEWTYVQYATAKIGAIQVNVNPAYRTSELEYALNQSGCRMLVTRTEYLTSKYKNMVEEIRPNVPDLERVVYFDTDDWAALITEGREVGDAALADRAQSLSNTDPINIQYTSGTTGFPKGATLSHRNILNDAKLVADACDYDHTDRVCIPVSFYHCFGMVMGTGIQKIGRAHV
jgi:fatty-acyl-CoA synthase